MVRLVAKTAGYDILPVTIGNVTLSEAAFAPITSVAPFKGQTAKVSEALKTEIGAAFPDPGRTTGKANARAVWSGLGQALILGAAVAPKGAALTDQTDAWTWLVLEGAGVQAVLAQLTPLDLRDSQFKRGHAARSLLGHMSCVFFRTGAEKYELLVFRSMTQTAVHDLSDAMKIVQAQAKLFQEL